MLERSDSMSCTVMAIPSSCALVTVSLSSPSSNLLFVSAAVRPVMVSMNAAKISIISGCGLSLGFSDILLAQLYIKQDLT